MNLADATGRLARWGLRLSELEFEEVHLAGIKHQAANFYLIYRQPLRTPNPSRKTYQSS